MFIITVNFTAKTGYEDTFLERVHVQAKDSLENEAGCRQFDVSRSPEDARRFLLYEVYTSADAFSEHLETAHFRQFNTDTELWIEEKTVERWERIEERFGL
jgi:quinol monooxygenase YgiN